jgi:hypothetical protein
MRVMRAAKLRMRWDHPDAWAVALAAYAVGAVVIVLVLVSYFLWWPLIPVPIALSILGPYAIARWAGRWR